MDEASKMTREASTVQNLPDITPIMQALDFTPEDLELNRSGRISDRQTERILLDALASIGCLGAIVLVIGCVAAAGLTAKDGYIHDNVVGLFIGSGVFLLAIAWIIGWTSRDALTRRCQSVSGQIELIQTQRYQGGIKTGISYEIAIQGYKFSMSSAKANAVMIALGNGIYRIYFSSGSKILLSAEPVSES